MKFGVMFANSGPFATSEGAEAMARAAEDAGFESLWTVEHVVVPAGYESEYPYDKSGKMPGGDEIDIPDPFVWLAYVAGLTSEIELATGIVIANQRNPLITAKEVATLDRLSGGRMLYGVGVGWLEEEFRALGVPFERRGARLDEYLEATRALWAEPRASYHGEFVDFTDAISRPQPAGGSVPIHIGGHTEPAARRAGRLGDGFFPARGNDERLRELIAIAHATALEHGRDPEAIEITTGGAAAFAPDPVAALRELEAGVGVHRVVIPPLSFDPREIGAALGRFGDDVIAKVG